MRNVTLRLLAAALWLAAVPAAAQRVASVAPAAEASPDAARVLVSEGETMLVRGASFSTPVRPEVPIRSGDRIRTGADGRVQLRFADGALISIQPGSDFRVEQWAFDASRQRSFFQLVQGSVRAVSGAIGKRDRDDFRLKTPTATIGIRGTEFTVDETACPSAGCPAGVEPGLTVAVIAGRVAVTNSAGSVEVPAGATLRLRDARTV
ncbi:MAG TPA: FecR family protein, partial [Burkholderiaceae bacterium]|nr:FecR family protein [Burkholderiaceae bacterium]